MWAWPILSKEANCFNQAVMQLDRLGQNMFIISSNNKKFTLNRYNWMFLHVRILTIHWPRLRGGPENNKVKKYVETKLKTQ